MWVLWHWDDLFYIRLLQLHFVIKKNDFEFLILMKLVYWINEKKKIRC